MHEVGQQSETRPVRKRNLRDDTIDASRPIELETRSAISRLQNDTVGDGDFESSCIACPVFVIGVDEKNRGRISYMWACRPARAFSNYARDGCRGHRILLG